jgi:RNA polymerase sigma-70 factor (ECF subfamily)
MSQTVDQLQGLYQTHGPALLAYLRRMAGRGEAAEDLLHETFVQALRGADRMEQVVSPRAWLFAIGRNVAITALRRRRTTASLPDDVAARSADPEDDRLAAMRHEIRELPDKLREALELRLQHDLSYEEIAAVLSIPVGTVRSRLHNAVRQLREALKDCEE